MLEISEYTSDPRVYMWMAKEFERGGVYSAAASWYKKAYQAGVAEAKDGFVRCNKTRCLHCVHKNAKFGDVKAAVYHAILIRLAGILLAQYFVPEIIEYVNIPI